jgi:mRNA interferase HicA
VGPEVGLLSRTISSGDRFLEDRLLGRDLRPFARRLDGVHIYVYTCRVKKRELEDALKELGFEFERHGGKHDVWKRGEEEIAVPRHTEINERLARGLIKQAQRGRSKK